MRGTDEVDWEKNVTMTKVAERNNFVSGNVELLCRAKNIRLVHYTVIKDNSR